MSTDRTLSAPYTKSMRLTLVYLLLLLLLTSCGLPSDKNMVRTFEKQKPLFEEVVAYFQANPEIRAVSNRGVHPSFVHYTNRPRAEGADARLEELLDTLKLESVGRSTRRTPGGVFLDYQLVGYGLGPDYKVKGFTYLPKAPSKRDLAPSLDDIPTKSLSPIPIYKHLQGNWYLYIWSIE